MYIFDDFGAAATEKERKGEKKGEKKKKKGEEGVEGGKLGSTEI